MAWLSVENLTTYYFGDSGAVRAVDGVSFTMEKGECLGVAGESGCGKTTLGLSLLRLVQGGAIVGGRVRIGEVDLGELSEGQLRRLRWEKISLIPQAALGALNPVHRIGDQIAEAIIVHRGLSKTAARAQARELLARVGLHPQWAERYPHELSGGMRQRAVVAMALALDPELVIADEPTTSLDVIHQAQTIRLMKQLQQTYGLSMLLISHDLSLLAQACERILIFYAGKAVEMATTAGLLASPRHPYTRALLRSFPDLTAPKGRLTGLGGAAPDLVRPPPGCRFHPRCPEAAPPCRAEEPRMAEWEPEHLVACHLYTGRH